MKSVPLWTVVISGFSAVRTQDNATGTAGTVQMLNSPNGGTESFLFAGAGSVIFVASNDRNTFMTMTLMEMPLVHINTALFLESGAVMEIEDGDDRSYDLRSPYELQ